MGIESWAFEQWLGHDEGALMNETEPTAYSEKTWERSVAPSPMLRHGETSVTLETAFTLSVSLISDFQLLQVWGIPFGGF